MKYVLSLVLVGVLVLGCTETLPTQVADDEPLLSVASKAPLYGEMDLTYNLGWPGPQANIPDWVGSITIDDVEYGMIFYNIGPDTGVTVIPSSTYRMNGVVEEAYGPFVQWEGLRVHMMGDIIWHDFGAPHFAPGVFRVN